MSITESKTLLISIVLIFTFGQVGSDLYIPSLVSIAQSLETESNMVQLSITAYITSMTIMQPIYGIYSDGYGRKPIIFIGTILTVIGSVICIFAHSIYLLLLGRFIQGLGAGAGATVCRAIIRDLYSGNELIKMSSKLAVSNVTFMISAPALGGYLEYYINWRACFAMLLLISLYNLISIKYIIPETSKSHTKHNLKIKKVIKNFGILIKSKKFSIYSFISLIVYSGIFAWITLGPILLKTKYNLSSVHLGWVYFFGGIMYIIGNLLNRKYVYNLGMHKLINYGLFIIFFAASSLFIGYYLQINSISSIVLPIGFYMMGVSLIVPNVTAGALNQFNDISGTASALFGTIQTFGAIISSLIISASHDDNILPVAIIFLLISIIGFCANKLSLKYD